MDARPEGLPGLTAALPVGSPTASLLLEVEGVSWGLLEMQTPGSRPDLPFSEALGVAHSTAGFGNIPFSP